MQKIDSEKPTTAYIIAKNDNVNLVHFKFPETLTDVKLLGVDYELLYQFHALNINTIILKLTDDELSRVKYALIKEFNRTSNKKDFQGNKQYVQYIDDKVKKIKPLPADLLDLYTSHRYVMELTQSDYESDMEGMLKAGNIHELNEYKQSVTYVEHTEDVHILSRVEFVKNSIIKDPIEIDKRSKLLAKKYRHLVDSDNAVEHEIVLEDVAGNYIKSSDFIIYENNVGYSRKMYRIKPRKYFLDYFVNKCSELKILRDDTEFNIPQENYQVVSVANKTKVVKRYILRYCSTFIDPLFNEKITLNDAILSEFKEIYCIEELLVDEVEAYNILYEAQKYVDKVIEVYIKYLDIGQEISHEEKKFLFKQEFLTLQQKVLANSVGNNKVKKILNDFVKSL